MLSKSNTLRKSSSRNYLWGIAFAAVLLVGYQAWGYYSTPPTLQATEDARRTLDALFTALTARDQAKLATCMTRIEVHLSESKLSQKATRELRYCEQLAKAGSWEQAAKRLYWIIYEQPL